MGQGWGQSPSSGAPGQGSKRGGGRECPNCGGRMPGSAGARPSPGISHLPHPGLRAEGTAKAKELRERPLPRGQFRGHRTPPPHPHPRTPAVGQPRESAFCCLEPSDTAPALGPRGHTLPSPGRAASQLLLHSAWPWPRPQPCQGCPPLSRCPACSFCPQFPVHR